MAGIHSHGYHLVAGDLRCQSDIESTLSNTGISWTTPTLLLAECSITYMDEPSSSKFIEWASSKFHNATFVTFEQIHPDDGFGLVMKHHFESLGSPLLSLDTYPHLQSQSNRYKKHGWNTCVSRSAYDVLRLITEKEKLNEILRLEPFDEFESWHLMCCHYTLTVASKGELDSWCSDIMGTEDFDYSDDLLRCSENVLHWTVIPVQGRAPERYGHAGGKIDEDHVVLVGGFGRNSNQEHNRLSEISIVNIKTFTVQHTTFPLSIVKENSSLDAMHSTCTPLPDGRLLLLGGRTSPKQPVNTFPVILSVWKRDLVVVDVRGPCPRWRHTATVCDSESSTICVLIYGGRTQNLTVLNDMWELDINRCAFTEISHSDDKWPCARFSHSAVALMEDSQCSLIISGGLNETVQPLMDIWMYDIGKRSWQEIHIDGPQMLPRYSHTSAITSDNKFLLLLGGVNTQTVCQPGLCVIDLLERKCWEYALPVQDPDKPVMLHNHTSELIDDSTFLIFGGGDNCFSFGTSFNSGIVKLVISHLLH